jgi:hypothetical protein
VLSEIHEAAGQQSQSALQQRQVDVTNISELRLAAFAMKPIGNPPVGVSDGGENTSGASAEATRNL